MNQKIKINKIGLIRLIRQSKKILIATHVNPDGDAVGSLLALGLGLKQLKKKITLYMRDPVPRMYQFLPSRALIQNALPSQKFDLTLIVDVGDRERVSDEIKAFAGCGVTVSIDHPAQGPSDVDFSYCLPKRAACGEIIFELFKALRLRITKPIATCLYTAIVTDTGSFKYSNTTSATFEMCARLVAQGVEVWRVAEQCFETSTAERLLLLSRALAGLTVHPTKRIAWITLRHADFLASGALPEDTEGLINYPRSIDTVEVAIFFKEQADGKIKVSFRSKETVDVAKLALEWKGGGHARASGCTMMGTMEEVVNRVVERVENYCSLRSKVKGRRSEI